MRAVTVFRGVVWGLLLAVIGCQPSLDSDLAPAVDAEPSSSLVGKTAPDIEGSSLDGSSFSLREQYAGNIVLLDFWATWCGPCVMELPILLNLAEEYQSRGVVLITVNAGEDAATIQQFQKEQNWNFPVVLDPEGRFASAYQVNGIPQLVVVDKGGLVQEVSVGYSPSLGDDLRTKLDELLAK